MKVRTAVKTPVLALFACAVFAGCPEGGGSHTRAPVLTGVSEAAEYLAGAEGGDDWLGSPVPLRVNLPASEWPALYDAVAEAGKYVALDMSPCRDAPAVFPAVFGRGPPPYFGQHESPIVSLVLPAGVTAIDDYAFGGCNTLKQITLPQSLKSIGDDAFNGCANLYPNITLPAGVASIGDRAFFGTGFTHPVLPAGLTHIGINVFNNCWQLTQISCLAATPPVIKEEEIEPGVFVRRVAGPICPIRVPRNSVSAYKAAWVYHAEYISGM